MVDEFSVGREPITVVEIDQDFCSLEYGVLPCQASLGVTGQRKCFNTLNTCQDISNFNKSFLTLRFSTDTSYVFTEALVLPSVRSVSTRATEINVGGGNNNSKPLGRRASVTITLQDTPWNDKLVDKYRTERDYNPIERGTFWSKWLNRNPYYQNRPIRVKEGYVGQSLSEMRTRSYVIDEISGPDSNGRVTIKAKDILKLADDKKAQAPLPSNGQLSVAISDSDTVFDLLPAGVGDEEYPASGTASIGDEIVLFTRVADTITLTQRGVRGSEIQSHDEGDTFQLALVYQDVRVENVIYDLLVNYANIDPSFINLAEWNDEASEFLAGYLLTTIITEPEGVNKLLSELVEQCICYIFWDEIDQKIRFDAIKPIIPAVDVIPELDESNAIIADSFKVERKSDERLSQVWVYYTQRDPTESIDKKSNFGRVQVNVDLDAETDLQYGEKSVKEIFSRWFDGTNNGEALTTGTRILSRYRDNPLYVTFDVDAKDRSIKTADIIQVTHRSIVDDTGQEVPVLLQVISTTEVESGHKMRYRCQEYGFSGRLAFIVPDDYPDYSLASQAQRNFGAWIAPDSGFFADDTEAYKII